MRGLTMVLVVYSHVCNYCLGSSDMGANGVFFLFRLPCFFFISGWLFFKAGRQWDGATIRAVVSHKFMVQIVPTFIFLLLLAPPPLFFTRLGAVKGGYWFTFALFEFFVIYICSARWCRKWGWAVALTLSAAAYCYDVLFNRYFASMGIIRQLLGFLSFMTWRYYLFFFLGALAREHADTFLRWTGKGWVLALVLGGFVLTACLPRTEVLAQGYLRFAVSGVLGVVLVFTFFRTFAPAFSKAHWVGRGLQFIGTRTLDIYLLHYFFLPRFLLPCGERLRDCHSVVLEFAVALSLALLVTAVCLLASRVVRLSPFLARYLFGVQPKSC